MSSKLQYRRDSSLKTHLWVMEEDKWKPYKQSQHYSLYPDKASFSPGYPLVVGCLKLGYEMLPVKNAY